MDIFLSSNFPLFEGILEKVLKPHGTILTVDFPFFVNYLKIWTFIKEQKRKKLTPGLITSCTWKKVSEEIQCKIEKRASFLFLCCKKAIGISVYKKLFFLKVSPCFFIISKRG